MRLFTVCRKLLLLSLLVTLLFSLALLCAGLVLYLRLSAMVNDYFDPQAKNLNLTRLLINAHESIVPTKDYLPSELDLGTWHTTLTGAVVFLALAMASFSVYGLWAASTKRPFLMVTVAVLLTAALICHFVLFADLINVNSSTHQNAQKELVKILHENYEAGAKVDNAFTFAMNSFMLMGECCGVMGAFDFLDMNLIFVYSLDDSERQVQVLFPPACCQPEFIKNGFHATLKCASSKTVSNINNRGCYEQVFGYVRDRYGSTMKWLFILIIVWEMLQAMLSLVLLFRPPDEEKRAVKQALEAAGLAKEELKESMDQSAGHVSSSHLKTLKKRILIFVPYARESSRTYRISSKMSTEIY